MVITSSFDGVRNDTGGDVSGDVSSVSEADSLALSCRNAFIRGHLTETQK